MAFVDFYRGNTAYINSIAIAEGQVLFDEERQTMYVDNATTRVPYSGGGSDGGEWLGSFNISAGLATYTITSTSLTTTSMIDIYFSESSKETVADSEPSFVQGSGSLTITFASALASAVTIENIHVWNPS